MKTYRLERLGTHPAARLAGTVQGVMLPGGNGVGRMLITFPRSEGFPFLPPEKYRGQIHIHELIEAGEHAGRSWLHDWPMPGTGWKQQANGYSVRFVSIDDGVAVVGVRVTEQ